MAKDKYYGKTLRKNFARHEEVMAMPNLLEIQKKSYKWFFETGLQEVFDDVDTITDYAGNLELSFIGFSMDDPPKYTIEECKAQDATYAKPIKVQVRLRNIAGRFPPHFRRQHAGQNHQKIGEEERPC